jgi:hypothetical protein
MKRSLSGLEKFGLISSIIGLIADCVALITFMVGLWSLGSSESIAPSKLGLFFAVTALVLLYGWVALAWIFARLGLSRLPEKKRGAKVLDNFIARSTASIGILIFPLGVIWTVAITKASMYPESTEGVEVFAVFVMGFVYLFIFLDIYLTLYNLMPLIYEDLAASALEDDKEKRL